MEKKNDISLTQDKSRWLRLGVSIILAIILTAAILFIPVATTTSFHLPSLALPNGITVNLPLTLDAQLVRAANGLTITKVATPTAVVDQGGFITYTLTITNNTGTALNTVVVNDTVPAHTSCDKIFDGGDTSNGEWLASQSSCDGGTVQWTYVNVNVPPPTNPGGDFSSGEVATVSYRVAVDQPLRDQVDEIVNNGYLVVSNDSVYSDTGTVIVTHTVNAPAWEIDKVAVPTTVEPRQYLTYTLTVTNTGSLTTSGLYTISDVLPNHTNYVAGLGTSPDNFDGTTLVWNSSTPLATGEPLSVTYVVTVTYPLTDGTKIVNQTYNITGGNVFSQAFGVPVTVTVDSPVTMTISKIDVVDPVQAGNLLTYTITISNDNNSTGPAQNLVFTDTIPTNTIFDNAGFIGTTSGITNTDGSVVTWTVSSPSVIPVGDSVQLTLTVRVLSPLANNTIITNSNYGLTTSNTLSVAPIVPVTTTVASAPVITLTKTVTPQVVVANQQLTYTIVVTNSGNETAVNIPLTDTIHPASGFTPLSATWMITVPGKNLTGTVGVITRTLVAASGALAGNYPNFVTTTVGSNLSIGPVATVTVRSPVDLQISKTRLGPNEVLAGTPITYTITITNAPGAGAADVIVTDTFTNAAVLTHTISFPGATCNGTGAGPVVCNIPGFTPTTVITLVLNTSSSISGVVANTAQITTSISGLEDSDPTNNQVDPPVTTLVRYPITDLEIDKVRVGTGELVTGDLITYTITVTNPAGYDTVDVVITDTFSNAAFQSYTSTITGNPCGTSTPAAGPLACAIANFTNTETITLVLDTASSISGTISNSAIVTFSPAITAVEINTADNRVDPPVTDSVRYPTADLQISKVRVGSGTAFAGESITYTLTITNSGPDTLDVVVTDTFTGSVTLANSSTTLGPLCSSVSNQVICSFSGFTNTATITLALNTSPTFSGTLTNTAYIESTAANAVDLNPGDNVDTVFTSVRMLAADLQISKNGPANVVAGDSITYTLTITNAGPDTVDALITDTFSTGSLNVTLNSVTPGSGTCTDLGGGIIECDISGLTNTETITVVLDTPPSLTLDTLTNQAEITFTVSNAIDSNTGNNSDVVPTFIIPRNADLQIKKELATGGSLSSGDQISFTLTITNAGPHPVNATLGDFALPGTAVSGIDIVAPGWGCSGLTASSLQCSNPSFNLGTETITVVMTSSTSYSGILLNNANIQVGAGAIENDADDNFDSAVATIGLPGTTPILTITKTALPPSGNVSPGDTITYSVAVENIGTAVATGVVITDDLPFGVGYVTGSNVSNGTFTQSGGQVTVTSAALGINQLLTATWQVTVTAVTSGTTLENSAATDSTETGSVSSAIVSHQVVTVATPLSSTIFMPIILKNCCLPNLTIESFNVDATASNPPQLTIVVRNTGRVSTGSGFWVDVYVDPSHLPEDLIGGVNPGDLRWQRVSTQGIAWSVPLPLAAGDSVTLSSNAGFISSQTNWTALTPGVHQIYTFVDSYDADDNWYVEVFENDETDNLAGPEIVTIVAKAESGKVFPVWPLLPASPRKDFSR